MATAVGLAAQVEALAALAALARIENEGLEVDARSREMLEKVAVEVLGADADLKGPAAAAVVGLARAFLRQGLDTIERPGRGGQWAHVDPELLQGLGRLSGAIVQAFRAAAESVLGVQALSADGAAILDIGTGTGWLAIACARAWPGARVVGIDLYEPSLSLAKGNVEREGLAERVELRAVDATQLDEREAYDAIWVPLPFLPPEVVPTIVARAAVALRPGGAALLGNFAGPPDRLSQLLLELRTIRAGGKVWSAGEAVALMQGAGLVDGREIPRSWAAPVQLFVASKPSSR